MRILHVSDNSYPNIGGVERVVHELAKRQVRDGHKVLVVAGHENMYKARLQQDGVFYLKYPYYQLPLASKYHFRRFLPDLVHVNSYLSSPLYVLDSSRVVRHVHDVYLQSSNAYFSSGFANVARLLESTLLGSFRNYIVPSVSTYSKLASLLHKPSSIWIIPNGVDTTVFYPREKGWLKAKLSLPTNFQIVGFVGRLSVGKGALDALVAVAPLLKRKEKLALVFVGPPSTGKTSGQASAFPHILKFVKRFDLEKQVIFLPPLNDSDLAKAYSDMEVLLLPSSSEGFGLTVLEAAACGTPSVVYHTGSLPEVVKNETTGFIVRFKAIDQLTERVSQILDEKVDADKIRGACVEWANRFSWNAVYSSVMRVYECLVGGQVELAMEP
jgi:glycosyltransferase involved in cell wall biosynthesis